MLAPFFALAAQSPSRQAAFRRAAMAQVVTLGVTAFVLGRLASPVMGNVLFGNMALVAGIVAGASLVGWRLAQLPKSQALEFLLVSPLRPARLFLAEALVGLGRLSLVTLCGLPVLAAQAGSGGLTMLDIVPLLAMPFTWGAVTGLGLAVWAYEPLSVRRWGERVLLGVVVVYLLLGVLAGEHIKAWLGWVPDEGQRTLFNAALAFHRYNPFALMKAWFEEEPALAWPALAWLEGSALATIGLLLVRGASRLQGHFRELHYLPQTDPRAARRPPVGDHPLSWWSVKRVLRYSGRINFWLIAGVGLGYGAYTVAGPLWPGWLGKAVFQILDRMGGAGTLATALAVLAAVPAAFQYGLWDANEQDRCRRLELLLLTRLGARDYWEAAAAAAWRRGRGYFGVAVLLWLSALAAGQATWQQVGAALAAAVVLWGLYFVLGFRAFARGVQANGLGMVLTLGVPLAAYALHQADWPRIAGLLPPASIHAATHGPPDLTWVLGPGLAAVLALVIGRRSLGRCDRELRAWYEAHHGRKVMT
jgi:hypothetical protein